MFKIGDRVRLPEGSDYYDEDGLNTGVIVGKDGGGWCDGRWAVRLDDLDRGHTCGGLCPEGGGLWLDNYHIELDTPDLSEEELLG